MFNLHCHICQRQYLVGPRSIASFHNTSDGPVAYAQCPRGHVVLRSFRDDRSRPVEAAA